MTRLLDRWSDGDTGALGQIVPLVYGELRRVAGAYARRNRPGHTLQATALVNEAYLRLFGGRRRAWQSRAHFLAAAAQVMRQVLVDHGRERGAQKRGGGQAHMTLSALDIHKTPSAPDLVALDDALSDLARIDPEEARVVELRFFGGLSIDETAEALGVSTKTVVRQWRRARAWLYRELKAREITGEVGS